MVEQTFLVGLHRQVLSYFFHLCITFTNSFCSMVSFQLTKMWVLSNKSFSSVKKYAFLSKWCSCFLSSLGNLLIVLAMGAYQVCLLLLASTSSFLIRFIACACAVCCCCALTQLQQSINHCFFPDSRFSNFELGTSSALNFKSTLSPTTPARLVIGMHGTISLLFL